MLQCTNSACGKEVPPGSFFCTWCGHYAGRGGVGVKANLFVRWVALTIDPMIGIVLWISSGLIVGAVSADAGVLAAVLFPLAYTVWYLTLLRQGKTPGKMMMGLQVLDQSNGEIPGFGKMFLREIVGRFLSGLIFGLGYLWALFDKSGQAWHDKLAGTVVVKTAPAAATPLVKAHQAGQ